MPFARFKLDLQASSDHGRPARIVKDTDVVLDQTSSPDCVLLDSTGELQDWYAVASIVFVGKSLTAHGGQNPVEPILAGKPVLFGPYMENFFALARALVANRAAVQVNDSRALEEKIGWLLREPEAASALVANAQAVLTRHSGSTARA